jgi:hypothetical protein
LRRMEIPIFKIAEWEDKAGLESPDWRDHSAGAPVRQDQIDKPSIAFSCPFPFLGKG